MTTPVSRWRALQHRDEDGLSLVELMIALMIMGIALLAVASTAAAALVQVRNSRTRQQATDAASAFIENLRLREFSAIAMDGDDPDVQALGGCGGDFDEPLVTTTTSGFVDYESVFPVGGPITVRVLVTWYDDGDDNACTDSDHDRTSKRVTAIASWTDGGSVRQVEESTLVSYVGRGLPAPDFRLGTPQVALDFTPTNVADDDEICVGHVLRNLGAQDGYEWSLERIDNGAVTKSNPAEFFTADGDWKVRAFFEVPASPDPIDPSTYGIAFGTTIADPIGLPEGTRLMVDDDNNGWPETDARVDPGEQARIWFCYRAADDDVGTDIDFEITVRSRFDHNRTETALHGLSVQSGGLTLYLFDDYDGAVEGGDSERVVDGSGQSKVLPTFTMGPATLIQPERLDTTVSISDHDTDLDPNGFPGLMLDQDTLYTYLKANGKEETVTLDTDVVRWHEQFSEDTTLGDSATLYLWLSTTDMLEADDDDETARRLNLLINVYVMNKQESAIVSTLYSTLPGTPYTYLHTVEGGFQERAIPLTLANATLDRNEYLRLEIQCQSVSLFSIVLDDECHIGYDHEDLPSRLTVTVEG